MAKYNKVIQLSGHTDRNAPPKQTTRTETSKIDALIRERERKRERDGMQRHCLINDSRLWLSCVCETGLNDSFLKMGHPRPLFRLYSSFQTHITILTTNVFTGIRRALSLLK